MRLRRRNVVAGAPAWAGLCHKLARFTLIPLLATQLGCGSDDTIGDAAPKMTVPPPSTAHYNCSAGSDEERPMLAMLSANRLYYAYRNGAVSLVLIPQLPDNDAGTHNRILSARGDGVALHLEVASSDPNAYWHPYLELAVVGVDGQPLVQWQEPHGVSAEVNLVGDTHGTFAFTALEKQFGSSVLVNGAELTRYELPMTARSDPDPQGRMVMLDYDGPATDDFHFFDVHTQTSAPSLFLQGEYLSPATVHGAGGIVYLQRDPAALIYENADGQLSLPLAVDLTPIWDAPVGKVHDGGWLVYALGGATLAEARYLAVHPSTETVRVLTLSPPSPWQRVGGIRVPPAIDARGRLLVQLVDGDRRQLFATEDGLSWQPMGQPVTEGDNTGMALHTAGGAVVIEGYGNAPDVAEGALPAGSWQLVGPDGGPGVELIHDDGTPPPYTPITDHFALSPDGHCLAYFSNGTLRTIDTADYAEADLGWQPLTWRTIVEWIPLPQ